MDVHNYLVIAWYVFNLLIAVPVFARGYDDVRKRDLFLNIIAYVVMTAAIGYYGDWTSWQAITLFVWWTTALCTGFAQVGKRVDISSAGVKVFTTLFTLFLMLLGATIPSFGG